MIKSKRGEVKRENCTESVCLANISVNTCRCEVIICTINVLPLNRVPRHMIATR